MKEEKTKTIQRKNANFYITLFTNPIIDGIKPLIDMPGSKFRYFVKRNLDALSSITNAINRRRIKLLTERGELSEKFNEAMKSFDVKYPMDKRREQDLQKAIQEDMDSIFKKYPKDAEKVKTVETKFKEYLEEKVEIPVYMIRREELPEEFTTRMEILLEEEGYIFPDESTIIPEKEKGKILKLRVE